MSRWVYVVIVLVLLYYLHSNPPLWAMVALRGDSVGYSTFIGKWYDKRGRIVEWTTDTGTFMRAGTQYDMEDPHIYAVVGSPKLRFETELYDGVLSAVFVVADSGGKWMSMSIDGGKAVTYWRDKRKARKEAMGTRSDDDDDGR